MYENVDYLFGKKYTNLIQFQAMESNMVDMEYMQLNANTDTTHWRGNIIWNVNNTQ